MQKRFMWLLLVLLVGAGLHAADNEPFTEGVHYYEIFPAVPTGVVDGKLEVVELFWYGCPHCNELEPYLNRWMQSKPAEAEFIRIPATLNANWIDHARLFYALELMGELERMHPLIFQAIHHQGRRLRDFRAMTRFVSQHGIDEQAFTEAYNSLAVRTKVGRAMQLSRDYGATGVPTVIVNGKYRTSATHAGSYAKMLDIINYLLQQERASSG